VWPCHSGGFRVRRAGNEHGQDQIELQTAQCTGNSGNVAMAAGSEDVESPRERRGEGSSAVEDSAEGPDPCGRSMEEVGEGAVADLAVSAEGLAEEDSGWGAAVGTVATCMSTPAGVFFATWIKTNEFSVMSLGTSGQGLPGFCEDAPGDAGSAAGIVQNRR